MVIGIGIWKNLGIIVNVVMNIKGIVSEYK